MATRIRKPPPRSRRTGKPFTSARADRDRDHDHLGRFKKGNKLAVGLGNPHLRRAAEYQKALRTAVTVEDLTEVMRVLVTLAKSGDAVSIRELLNRTIGKATVFNAKETAAVKLPTLSSPADAVEAVNAVMAALGDGSLSPDDAVKLTTIVELARRALETHDLSVRLARLEQEQGEDQ